MAEKLHFEENNLEKQTVTPLSFYTARYYFSVSVNVKVIGAIYLTCTLTDEETHRSTENVLFCAKYGVCGARAALYTWKCVRASRKA